MINSKENSSFHLIIHHFNFKYTWSKVREHSECDWCPSDPACTHLYWISWIYSKYYWSFPWNSLSSNEHFFLLLLLQFVIFRFRLLHFIIFYLFMLFCTRSNVVFTFHMGHFDFNCQTIPLFVIKHFSQLSYWTCQSQ